MGSTCGVQASKGQTVLLLYIETMASHPQAAGSWVSRGPACEVHCGSTRLLLPGHSSGGRGIHTAGEVKGPPSSTASTGVSGMGQVYQGSKKQDCTSQLDSFRSQEVHRVSLKQILEV